MQKLRTRSHHHPNCFGEMSMLWTSNISANICLITPTYWPTVHSVKAQAGLRKRSSRKYTINGCPYGPNTPKRPRCMKETSLHVIPAKLASRRVLSADVSMSHNGHCV